MNPIKTPQEMMYEQAGIPHLAGGGLPKLSAGAENVLRSAIKKFSAVFGRTPNAEELSQLEAHANKLSMPTNTAPANIKRLEATTPAQNMMVDASGRAYQPIHSIDPNKRLLAPEEAAGYNVDPFGSTPANFRAREGLYAPDVKAFESRDPFLTEAMTGRATSRTRQKPFTTSIDELVQNKAHLENKGIYGDVADVSPGGYPTQSTTPSADYFAEMASKIEAAKLPTNIRSTLRDVLKREPTDDEINAAIANLNVARHDYTGKGAAIFGERPTTSGARPTKAEAADLADWRQRAIDSGQSRTSVMDTPRHIEERTPNLYNEMQLGPDTGFAQGGSTNPKQMRADMMVCGYADGGSPGIAGRGFGALGASSLMNAGEELAKGNYLSGTGSTIYGLQGLTQMAPKLAAKLLPSSALRAIPGIGNAFMLYDALKPNESIASQEYEQAQLANAPKTLEEAKRLWAAQDAAKSKK
jgi:hypothetical protein